MKTIRSGIEQNAICKRRIFSHFLEEFNGVLTNEDPIREDVEQVFEWLKDEARSALSFAHINAIDICRREAERKLLKTDFPKKEIWKKSKDVLHELAHRFDELRTTKRVTKGRFSIVQGHKEEEKALPTN